MADRGWCQAKSAPDIRLGDSGTGNVYTVGSGWLGFDEEIKGMSKSRTEHVKNGGLQILALQPFLFLPVTAHFCYLRRRLQ